MTFARTIIGPRQVILAVLLSLYGAASASSQQSPHSDRATSVGQGNPLWSISVAALTATRERPIFSPTRRPPPVAVVAAPSQAPAAAQPPLALVGAIAGDREGIAIFLDGTTKGIIRLKTGETHVGWTLQVVKAREAILRREQETTVLVLPNPPAR
jgi:general secretion pathway protein N